MSSASARLPVAATGYSSDLITKTEEGSHGVMPGDGRVADRMCVMVESPRKRQNRADHGPRHHRARLKRGGAPGRLVLEHRESVHSGEQRLLPLERALLAPQLIEDDAE